MAHSVTFKIPPGTPPAKCRGCSAQIFFVLTKPADDRKHASIMPVNPDGVSHFATCPNAPKFRRRR